MKYKCPCCGYYTFLDKPSGNYDICEVCYWEDDPIQSKNPAYADGANHVSLQQARKNYKRFGACKKEMVSHVRHPKENELYGYDE